MNIKYNNIDLEIIITTPHRDAPPCSNPDSPNFGDPGDDCEFDIVSATCNGIDLSDEEVSKLYDDDDLYEILCEKSQPEMPDYCWDDWSFEQDREEE